MEWRHRRRHLCDHGAWWDFGLPRLVFSPEAAIHARIEALEQFNRDTRLLVLVRDVGWRRPPTVPQRPVVVIAAS
jgi:hypothetical protein